MPTHTHGIIIITVGAGLRPVPTDPIQINHTLTTTRHGLPEIMRARKSFSARRINELRGTPGALVWQRGYYEHIIWNERQLNRPRNYIETNPLRWKTGAYNPDVKR